MALLQNFAEFANIYTVMQGMKNSQINIKNSKSGSPTNETYCG